jgi:hypothetical protein
MNHCLSERMLFRIYLHERLGTERAHLRLCADCAERYDDLTEDLETISRVLEAPPPASKIRGVSPWWRWVGVATACTALIALVVGVTQPRDEAGIEVAAGTSAVSAFAADLSAALFATSGTHARRQFAEEAPYLTAALEAGEPCTRDRFLTGECNDQLSALLMDSD